MKILVIGLDCATPEILFADEELVNLRRLMEIGCFGRLESIIPPITVPAWMCLSTSRDPGSLGVYGFRNRTSYCYDGLGIVNSASIRELAVWDQVCREGKRANVIAVPPGFPPRKVNGIAVGCFLTPDTDKDAYTRPAAIKEEIARLVGHYPVDVANFRTHNKAWLKDEIYTLTRKHFQVVRHYLQHSEWDYFQFVEIGLDRIQHGFWKYHDAAHRQHESGHPFANVIRDYYRFLDDEVGQLLDLLDEETAVLVVSDHGAQRLDGGFCVNEWLVRQGLLSLHERPREITPFAKLAVNWSRTKVWSEGGYYARVFLNVKGREPQGTIDPLDYEKVRDEIKDMFEALPDDRGQPMGTVVYKPEEVYRTVNNIAPDLIVHFGGLYWRSIGGVGYDELHIQENDTGPDDCNHAQYGSFILAAPGCGVQGEVANAHLLDMAPTLLELGGYDIPPSMQGRSLLGAAPHPLPLSPRGRGVRGEERVPAMADESLVRERLTGLGYIS